MPERILIPTQFTRRDLLQAGSGAVAAAVAATGTGQTPAQPAADVCVYGAASGVLAAVAAAQEGCRVVLVEPSRRLGGMTGGGLKLLQSIRGSPDLRPKLIAARQRLDRPV